MPIKWKESSRKKGGGYQHYYMHNTPVEELKEALENDHTKPKIKQKIRNYLISKEKTVK